MGCNISPIVAIIFMDKIERRALNIFTRIGIFKRYIDDVFVLVEDQTAANTLYNVISNLHANIKFEIEYPDIFNTLNLLDISVRINETGCIDFKYYKKPAKKDIFIHNKSHVPLQCKINIIKNS